MTVSITMYGANAQYWNAGPFPGTDKPADVKISANSTTSTLYGSITLDGDIYTILGKGSFQFFGPISTLDKVSGVLTESSLYRNGSIMEFDVIPQGADLIGWFYPANNIAQYITKSSTLYSGVNFVGAQGGQQYGDALIAGTGKDVFTSYAGKITTKGSAAYFDGKGDVDLSVMQGKLEDYKIQSKSFTDQTDMSYKKQISGWELTDSVASRNGVTQLVNVERVQFTDTNLALDIAPTQNAGSVYMLYKAAFNRAPDAGGMGYWLAQKDSGKDIVTSLAQGFVGSKEFTDKYGTNPSNASYVDKLYQNVLGRAGESGGVAYWNQELDAGRISKAAVLVQFATLAEGAANVASLIANGISYTEYVG